MTNLRVFLINLDGSDTRLQAATSALRAQNVPFTRHAAFDGRNTNPKDVPEYNAAQARAYMGRDLTGGEVGCFISHVEVVRRFLKTDARFALVLEDDMQPLAHGLAKVQRFVDASIDCDHHWDVAHLAAERLKLATPLHVLDGQPHAIKIHRAHYFPMRATALIWSRSGAERFLRSAYPITCPVDIHFRRLTQDNDGGVAIQPPCFTTTQAASDIDAGLGIKRGFETRSLLYPLKRAARVLAENQRAIILRGRAKKALR